MLREPSGTGSGRAGIRRSIRYDEKWCAAIVSTGRVVSAMRMGWSPRPVFAFESLVAARRWQVYALRAVYVGLLLVGLTLTWGPSDRTIHSLAEVATIAGVFFRTVIAVQLAVVLLAAPAATASAVCVDKARGTLLHAFVTDLTDREIVLGKLGARLGPGPGADGLRPAGAGPRQLPGRDRLRGGARGRAGHGGDGGRLLQLGAAGLGLGPQAAPGPALGLLLVGLWVATVPVVHVLFLWGPPTSTAAVILDHVQPDPRRVRDRRLVAAVGHGSAGAGRVLPGRASGRRRDRRARHPLAAADGPVPGRAGR